MEKRRLGRTDLLVSPLGFGGIPLQRVSSAAAAELVQFAVEQGINFFDSARGYTDSEEKIGLGLRGVRERVVIATKSMARSGQAMSGDIERSLRNFRTDWVDLYQCHNVRSEAEWEELRGPGGGLEALVKAQEAGKIRYIGITGHLPRMLVRELREYPFAAVQFPYNYIEQEDKEELLAAIKKEGLGSIIMKPLAGGALGPNAGAAIRFLLSQSFDVIIPGMDAREQVAANISQTAKPFAPEDAAILAQAKATLGEDFCRRCEYCLPCSAGINIPFMFLLEGYYRRYGLQDWARERYAAGAVPATACTECGLCETRCPYQLPIREKLKQVGAMFELD